MVYLTNVTTPVIGYFITSTILEVHHNYHGYIVKVNAKSAQLTATYDTLIHSCSISSFQMEKSTV